MQGCGLKETAGSGPTLMTSATSHVEVRKTDSYSLSVVAPVDHVRLERPIFSQVSSAPHEDQTCQPLPQYSVCPTTVSADPPPQLCSKMFTMLPPSHLLHHLSLSFYRSSQASCISFSAFVLTVSLKYQSLYSHYHCFFFFLHLTVTVFLSGIKHTQPLFFCHNTSQNLSQ